MPTITENIALTREARDEAEREFRKALRAGRKQGMSWSALATVSGMSITGVRYLAQMPAKPKKKTTKGGTNGDG